jgi:riboflavin biosynthesis pyrimidine reductase
MTNLELLWSREPPTPARAAVEAAYGAALVLPSRRPYLVANFVETVDGVVAFGERGGSNASTVSMDSAIDRHVMALLRALADVVVVGAGTFRVARNHQWSPGGLVPDRAGAFDAFRRAVRGTSTRAPLVVVTASGSVDPDHAAFTAPETEVSVVTTEHGATHLRGRLPAGVEIIAAGSGSTVAPIALLEIVTARSGGLVLCEGGPTLLGELLREQLVDELFVTLAPQLAGRDGGHPRLGLVEGFAAAPVEAPRLALHSLRRAHDHLFLRYVATRSRRRAAARARR